MKSTITTAFPPPNNNTGTPDDDMDIDTDNDPAPKPVAPTMHVRDATPDLMAQAGPAQATPVQIIGPTSQPIIVSREQATVTQQAPGSAQEKSRQATDGNLVDQESQKAQLMLAAQDGDLPTIQALIFNGANVNAARNDGWTPLMFAAKHGHLPTIQALLSASDIDIHAKNPDGKTALHVAAVRDKDHVVKVLIDHGAEVNARTHDGRTLLGAVANRGHLPTLNALLSAPGINIDPVSRGLLNSIAIQRYITLKSQALSDEIRNRTNQRRHDLV